VPRRERGRLRSVCLVLRLVPNNRPKTATHLSNSPLIQFNSERCIDTPARVGRGRIRRTMKPTTDRRLVPPTRKPSDVPTRCPRLGPDTTRPGLQRGRISVYRTGVQHRSKIKAACLGFLQTTQFRPGGVVVCPSPNTLPKSRMRLD
jgi:hypothetical protein